MATTATISETIPSPGTPASTLLVSLTPLTPESLDLTLANLAAAFPNQLVDVATPDPAPISAAENLRIATYTPAAAATTGWVLTAADYLNTHKQLQDRNSPACILLGPEAQSLSPESLRALAGAVLTTDNPADLATPRYTLGPRDGLVNSAILYPVTRALFGTRPRYPLAIDLAFSARLAERLAACAQRLTASNQNAALIWPVAEAATASFTIAEVPDGARTLPQPDAVDLNSLLAQVAGSLFADLDAKASFWQRARLAYSPKAAAALAESSPAATPSLSSRSAAEGSLL